MARRQGGPDFGRAIRTMRAWRAITAVTLAKRLRCARESLSAWEHGSKEVPFYIVTRTAAALDVPVLLLVLMAQTAETEGGRQRVERPLDALLGEAWADLVQQDG